MIVNFIRLDRDRDRGRIEQETNIAYNDRNNSNNILWVSCMAMILYFSLNILPVFLDFIFGFMDFYDYVVQNPLVDMKKWLIVNGIFGYIGLLLLVMITRIYVDDTFLRRLLRVGGYVFNGFSFVWIIIGMVCFFGKYYNMKDYTSHIFFYNYLLVRMILGPIVSIYKFFELYFII